jgi:hypothetical protein
MMKRLLCLLIAVATLSACTPITWKAVGKGEVPQGCEDLRKRTDNPKEC